MKRPPRPKLRVFDLCAGWGTATEEWRKRGHEVVGVDLVVMHKGKRVPAHILQGDLLEIAKDPLGWLDEHVAPGWRPHHVHASPPCEGFAVPSIGRMWTKDLDLMVPKHPTARMALRLLAAAATIIAVLEADALAHGRTFTYTLENPRAMMRRAVADYHAWLGEPQEVAYCRYGPLGPVDVMSGPRYVYAQKSTDIWSNFATWEPLMCSARPPKAPVGPGDKPGFESISFTYRDGKPCHERAERGSRAGIQRIKGADARSLLPSGLSLSWCIAAETEHAILSEEE